MKTNRPSLPWLLGLTLLIGPPGNLRPIHARHLPAESLPSVEVLSNLRSATGRTVYLLCQLKEQDFADLQQRISRMAQNSGAHVLTRKAGDLWVAILESAEHGLTAHRLGKTLLITPTALAAPVQNTVIMGDLEHKRPGNYRPPGLSANQHPDEDLDMEVVLLAQRSMRSRETVPAGLVAQAQGAAARLLLHRYAQGDDLGAYLWGVRTMPLLAAHPDTSLLQRVVTAAQQVVDEPATTDPKEAPFPPAPSQLAGATATSWGPKLAALLVTTQETAQAVQYRLAELARKRTQVATNQKPEIQDKAVPAVPPEADIVLPPHGGTAGTNIRSAVEDKDGIDP